MKLSQESFADSIGMHRAYYWSIENGRRNVSIKLLIRVAEGLKSKLSEIIKEAGI